MIDGQSNGRRDGFNHAERPCSGMIGGWLRGEGDKKEVRVAFAVLYTLARARRKTEGKRANE